MAISIITAAATTLTDGASDPGLISQLNTALAPLLADNIRGVSFITQGDDRFIGNELQVAITYDTLGSPILNPYVAAGFQAKSIESVKSAMLAFISAHPSYFFSTAWIQPIPMQRNGGQYVGLIFYNVNAAQGAANWAVNGGASAGNVFTGHMLAVDAVVGDDAIAAALPYQAPFLTIQAAINAATSGDTVVLRPGTFTSAATILLKDGVNIRAEPGAVVSVTGNFKAIFGDSSDPFSGSGTAVTCRIMGHAKLLSVGHQIAVALRAASTVTLECDEIALATSGLPVVHISTPAAQIVHVRVVGQIRCGQGIIKFFDDQTGNGLVTVQCDDLVAIGGPVVDDHGGNNHATVLARTMNADAVVLIIAGTTSSVVIEATEDIIVGANNALTLAATCDVVVRARSLTCTARAIAVSAGSPKVVLDVAGSLSATRIVWTTAASVAPVIDVRARDIIASERVVYNEVGVITGSIVASLSITGDQIVVDIATSLTLTSLSVRAPTMTATNPGDWGFFLSNNGPVNYDIDCSETLTSGVRMNTGPTGVLRLRVGRHVGVAATIRVFDILTGIAFLHYDEAYGLAGSLGAAPIYCRGGTTHLLGGRLLGADADAGGHAVTIADDSSDVCIYPGTILVAGNDVGTKSIGIAGAAVTPTAKLMGAIAANKAKDAAVVVAIGSLLVDPLVA